MTLLFKENDLKVLEKLKNFDRISDVGNRVAAYFCASCGVSIYGVRRYFKGVFSSETGILNDTIWLRPTAVSYTHLTLPTILLV